MADSELPLDALAANYRMGCSIDGTQYLFDVRWNARSGSWYFDLLDENADPIVSGVRVVLGVLARRCIDPRFPNGFIFSSDLSDQGKEAAYDDLGARVKIYFRPAGDM